MPAAPRRADSPSLRHRVPGGEPDGKISSNAGGIPSTGIRRNRTIIGSVRHNPSTVVVLAGQAPGQVLAAVERSMNVVVVRPADDAEGIETAAAALRRAAGISAPTCSSPPTRWRRSRPSGARCGTCRAKLTAATGLSCGRARPWPPGGANQFELPDYYLVLTEGAKPAGIRPAAPATPEELRPDFYLGPLRSVRPHRVAVAAAAEPDAQAAALLSELGSLRTGRWWPSLADIFATVRGFYPPAPSPSPPTPDGRPC